MLSYILHRFYGLIFDEQVFQNALDAFAKRERRFGGTTSETDTVNLGG